MCPLEQVLVVDSISKVYKNGLFKSRDTLALSNLSFAANTGELVGIIGHNGAGKTTLFRILVGILESDSGNIEFVSDGVIVKGSRIRKIVGYVPSDERSFFWRLTGRQNLKFFGSMYGLSGERIDKTITEQSKALNLNLDKLFRDYSAGMRKKLSILRALLHEPDLLIMDEVTNSLDPESCKKVKSFIKDYAKKKSKTVLWSTHRLEEVGDICDKVLWLKNGKVDYFGKISGLAQYEKSKARYLIRSKAGQIDCDDFIRKAGGHFMVHTDQNSEYTDYIFSSIDQEHFGKLVHVAVKEYDAHIVFAGCVDKGLK